MVTSTPAVACSPGEANVPVVHLPLREHTVTVWISGKSNLKSSDTLRTQPEKEEVSFGCDLLYSK
jgi:hypothetical protein